MPNSVKNAIAAPHSASGAGLAITTRQLVSTAPSTPIFRSSSSGIATTLEANSGAASRPPSSSQASVGPSLRPSAALPSVSLWLLVAGGLTYVAGVAFYVWERLRFQNAIWHGFVAVAAGLHFAAVAVAVA